jgi:hypothetical protein
VKVTLRRGPNVLGVRTGADLDTKDLPAGDAEELRRLVEKAQLTPVDRGPGALMPDQQEVTVRIEARDRQLEVTFAEGQAPPEMDPLLEYLDRHATVIPNE